MVVLGLVAGLLGLATSMSPAHAAPTPPRTLLLIGGTFMGKDDRIGYDYNLDGVLDVPGWNSVVRWLETGGGYEENVNLFIGEMARQEDPPPNFESNPFGYRWNEDVEPLIEGIGGKTAGLTRMQESVDKVKAFIVEKAGAGDVDIVAHSQAAAISRAAIKELEQEEGHQGLVHKLISLGGANYGALVRGPEFNLSLLKSSVVGQYQTFLERLLYGTVGAVGMAECRRGEWLPLCIDVVRASTAPLPDPDNPIAGADTVYKSDFYKRLNGPDDGGPVPGTTQYWHLYSTIFKKDRAPEQYAAERFELRGASNLSVQTYCSFAGRPKYALHHVEEWVDPAMRNMIGYVLGFEEAIPSDYCNGQ